MDCKLIIAVTLLICVLPALPSPYGSRTRSRSSSPTYDQKQTGDYNIQLHLKDFQVVALLSEGALGDLGDYDYSYDYSELTVKPPSGSGHTTTKQPTTPKEKTTTPLPTTTTPTTTTTQTPVTTTIVPTTNHAVSVTTPVASTTTTSPTTTSTTTTTTTTPATKEVTAGTTVSTRSYPTTTITPIIKNTHKQEASNKPDIKPTTTEIKTTLKPFTTTEKRIHVEVVTSPRADTKYEEPIVKDEKVDTLQMDINIVPIKPVEILSSIHNKEESNQTELLNTNTTYRKCANGFTRDKQGRCRRVRRPVSQFPFGISRLATLASKLRQATGDGQTVPNLE